MTNVSCPCILNPSDKKGGAQHEEQYRHYRAGDHRAPVTRLPEDRAGPLRLCRRPRKEGAFFVPGIWKREKNRERKCFCLHGNHPKIIPAGEAVSHREISAPLLGALCGGAAVRVPGHGVQRPDAPDHPHHRGLHAGNGAGPAAGVPHAVAELAGAGGPAPDGPMVGGRRRTADGPAAGRLQLRPAAPAGPGFRELRQGHPGRSVPPHSVSALCLAQE